MPPDRTLVARGIHDELAKDLKFRGFDYNDPLEGHMARYVRLMMSDGQHWTELIPQIEAHDRGNSHMQMLEVYQRMLSEHRRIMDTRGQRHGIHDYFLSEEELARISRAQVHPPNRGRF